MRSQRGATFITWVAVAGIGIFMFLTGVKNFANVPRVLYGAIPD